MIMAFVGLSLLLAMTPGPDTFLVLRFSLRDAKSGIAAAAGSALGSLLWAFAVAVGLASLLEQSADRVPDRQDRRRAVFDLSRSSGAATPPARGDEQFCAAPDR